MKNRIIHIFAIILLSTTVYSRPIKISGIIKDSENGRPVSFANVAIVEIEKGTTSDYNGIFDLEIDSTDLNSNLNISCLNYKDFKIKISKLLIGKSNEILLENFSYEISEIVVSTKKKKHKEIELNKLKKSEINGMLTCDNLPKMYARYFPFEPRFEKMQYIQYLNIGFRNDQQKNKSKVRIRIFSNDYENNKPDIDILREDLIIIAKPGINKIDISNFNISLPKEGIFIAVEWLIVEENKYDWLTYNQFKIKKTETKYGPILGANYHQESFTWLYWAGYWEKYEREVPMVHPKIKAGSYFDSAISLTLSN
ncbi:MAG: carboxypeptidase-like regulatory domain-containing protein [Salinivirgaceae bacterium]|nr:carboxypeptidase-like regulatory domain-containing protein [Salinivirgaceae bacterium]